MAEPSAMRAVVVTPNAADGRLAVSFLEEAGIGAHSVEGLGELCDEIERAGCVVLAEEALVEEELPALHAALARQRPWSDVPLILVANQGTGLSALGRAFPDSGNVTLLERPLNPTTLVSAVQVGMRARGRQHQVRELLEQRELALRQRDEFLAMLAHELRNPLAPMRNAMYLQNSLPAADPRTAKTREILDRQIEALSRLVDDLLDVARLERGKVQLQKRRLDLNAVAAAAADACLPNARERGLSLRIALAAEPLAIEADPVRIDQLITNLLTNAVKFTPEGGEITLRTAREAGSAVISVQDNGIGIDPAMLDGIFSLFTQIDQSLARTSGGLGIGLTIARRLAELHDGTLRAESDGPGAGATFRARFPLAAAAPAALPASEPARGAVRPQRILVVEDNADIRESLRLILSFWGHHVLLAQSGGEGLELAQREGPEVALIDIGLPGMTGYDVARAIRGSAAGGGMRLVAITGYGQARDRERALAAGFDAHLLKPVDPQMLERILGP